MGVEIFTASSLNKNFPKEQIELLETSNSAFKNERFGFEVAIKNGQEVFANGTLKICGGLAEFCSIRQIELVAGSVTERMPNDDYTLKKEHALFPELLTPIKDGAINLAPNSVTSFFVSVKNAPAGLQKLDIQLLQDDKIIAQTAYNLEIFDIEIPKTEFIYTNWMHYDGISQYYDADVFSDKFYAITKKFMQNAFSHGVNCLYVPLFTPPLDTAIGGERKTVQLVKVVKNATSYHFDFSQLDKFINIASDVGYSIFELSHLFSQWGAEFCPKIMAEENGEYKQIFGWNTKSDSDEYFDFLSQFLPELNNYIEKNSMIKKCFYHISDEPSPSCIERYQKLAMKVKKLLPLATSIDALSNYSFYEKKLVDIPVVSTSDITPFLDNVDNLWAYYCCCQCNNFLSNRFFNFPSERNRVLGIQLYINNISGFLHWGYNFYNSYLSKTSVNPFLITDANAIYQAGDCFIVYPGKDEPLDSIRHEVFYDGIQDYRALMYLEKLTNRQDVIAMLDKFGYKKGFETYPHSAQQLSELRKQINTFIVNAL